MNGALAFTPTQLKAAGANQMNALIDRGIVDANFFEQTRIGGESTIGEHQSARACCRRTVRTVTTAHAGGSVFIFLNQELLTPQMNIVDVAPTQGSLGLVSPRVVTPGDPWNSVLTVRMAKTGSGHMPLIGAHEVDVEGLKLVEDWIARMPSDAAQPKPWTETEWSPPAIEGALGTVAGAMRLRRAIDDGKLNATSRALAFKIAWASSQPTVRDIFERFKPDEQREKTLGPTIDPAAILGRQGDPERGATLVSADGKLASCLACHFIRGHGRHFGPDLSRIGAQQTAPQILESILTPSKTVAPLYRASVFECRDGTSAIGFVRARGVNDILLTIPTGQSIKLRHADVLTEKTLTTSLMPEGQLAGLTPQEAADLVAYLSGLH
jgi:putative heme-binding domain-containing protein